MPLPVYRILFLNDQQVEDAEKGCHCTAASCTGLCSG